MAKVVSISYPSHVPVTIGLPEALVMRRELRNTYETNRDIKTVSAWLLLKALTQSNQLKAWRKQKDYVLTWLQMSERTFYCYLAEMIRLGLVESVDAAHNIFLVSYEKAAAALDVPYSGQYLVPYNPLSNEGKQTFQYILRAEEFRKEQERQLDALHYHLNNNPTLRNTLHTLLVQRGADAQRLFKDGRYFQERLLQLQLQCFREGSEILDLVFERRADINRGVTSIQKAHSYKAKTSVSYMKKRMWELKIITVDKKKAESEKRSRLYIPDGNGTKRDGYKWVGRTGRTVLFLTDQINFNYATTTAKKQGRRAAQRA